ncbi:MAG: hypothetical protein ACRC2R_14985 [Xenococcaceae cyanobacterium]
MKRFFSNKLKQNLAIYCFLFVFIFIAFNFLVVKNFSVPLTGYLGDGPGSLTNRDHVDFMEYPGFYLAQNLRFQPLPNLNLVGDRTFYPYGVNVVFQPWALERDYFYAIFYYLFGTGGWLQIYYFLSILITAFGTLMLLKSDYGIIRAAFASLTITFTNFYAVNKYPHHFNIAVLHWTVLSLIADFLIFRKLIDRQTISLKLILLRIALLILVLGQDLGYIAGFALTSFTITISFTAIAIVYKHLTKPIHFDNLKQQIIIYKNEFFTNPFIHIFLIGLTIAATYLYLPLVLQISQAAKNPELAGINSGAWWTNPIRLFLPYLPIFNYRDDLSKVFKDIPETLNDGRSGLFLLVIGIIGLWQSRRRIVIFLPLLTLFLLCLFYNPASLPTLKIFPWFAFNRVSGRSTVIYVVIFTIFALHANFNLLKNNQKRWLAIALIFLACLEIPSAYFLKFSYQPYQLNSNFYAYMNYVKQQSGEAVLDWPFCAKGGNRVGICPYYKLNGGVFALSRFHQKKVMGQFFGRLHPSQIAPYIQAGWDKLFVPNENKTRQTKCFSDREWSFFTDFYKYNDFAGINLYTNLLPADCVDRFYQHFGTPAIETDIPEVGRVVFIPKPDAWRSQVDRNLGKKIRLDSY